MVRERHPDAGLMASVREALTAWEGHGARDAPTSQVVGGGAVAEAERAVSAAVDGRPVVLLPSASWALLSAFRLYGVGPSTSVLVPRRDWVASTAAVRLLGGTPLPVDVDDHTGTIDPEAAAQVRADDTVAVVATHLGGVPADVTALRTHLDGLPVIEDCCQAWGARIDGAPVGTMGDLAVFSFAATKLLDCGEAAALAVREDLWPAALRTAAHPARQRLEGIESVDLTGLAMRVDPVAAIRTWYAVKTWDRRAACARRETEVARLRAADPMVEIVGEGTRREMVAVPVAIRFS